jgi:hypothetical protein
MSVCVAAAKLGSVYTAKMLYVAAMSRLDVQPIRRHNLGVVLAGAVRTADPRACHRK